MSIIINYLKLIIVLITITYVFSCGMITHIEISQRAFHHFTPNSTIVNDYKSILKNYSSFFTAGSPFPDWGYMCQYGDAGEYAHWPPFIHAYVNYLNENFQPRDKKYKKLVSFLFGIESHQESDIIWHWGKQSNPNDLQGYLRAMSHAASDCLDNWEKCHGVGDNGIDFYLSLRGNLSLMTTKWSIPVLDLYNIYQKIGMNVPITRLWACPEIMYVGSIFERIGSELALFIDEYHSAFLTQDIDLYFAGGLDDMALNVQWQWRNLINLLEGKNSSLRNNTFAHKKRMLISNLLSNKTTEEISYIKDLIGLTSKNKTGILTLDHDPELVEKNKHQIKLLLIKALGINENLTEKTKKKDLSKDNVNLSSLSSREKYSYFGKSLAKGDFNGDGKEEIVVGSPGYGNKQSGAIYILKDSNNSQINFSNPDIIGSEIYGRFGYSVAVADLNHDGFDDLIVSAPTSGESGPSIDIEEYYPKNYRGKIYIYFGGEHGIQRNIAPNVTISLKNKDEIFFNLGQYMKTADCNGDGYFDLLIGSPHAHQGGDNKGHVSVILGIPSNVTNFFIEDSDFTISGFNQYHQFGHSLQCYNNTVIVGAPGHRYLQSNNDFLSEIKGKVIQSSGAVFGYDLYTKKLKFSIECDYPQASFGHSLEVKDNLLVIGSPSLSNIKSEFSYFHGGVFIYDLNQLTVGMLYTSNQAFIKSYEHRSRFGHKVSFIGNDLAVTAPQYSYLEMPDEGKLYIYNDIHLSSGELDVEKTKFNAMSYISGARFGDQILVTNKTIIISSPYASNLDYNSGQISFIDLV